MGHQTQQGQYRLIDRVINQGICIRCGACVGLCPYFDYLDGKVVVMDRCNADTWRCLQLCPRAEYEGTNLDPIRGESTCNGEIGAYKKIIIARATDEETVEKSQYGGVVSALLIYAIEKGHLNSAVLTDAGKHLSPGGLLTRNRADIHNCAGSRYSGSGGLSALNRALSAGESKLGVVGLPCQMEALARLRLMKPDGEERSSCIALKIGLFCTWAVDYRQLEAFLKKEEVEGPVKKYDIPPPPAEKFKLQTEKGWIDFPLSDIRELVQKGCVLCQDMTAEWADISVGTVEGRVGWNTVIVRTDVGSEIVDAAIKHGWLETDHLPEENLDHLKEASLNKLKRAKKLKLKD
jgi:coenzyme F420 hydrogenase subunit beta